MKISREDWSQVREKASEILNASEADDRTMVEVHTNGLMEILADLEGKYGRIPAILATRADFLDDYAERKALYLEALDLAIRAGDGDEILEIKDSMEMMEQDEADVRNE
jgi:hypothetical protein